jgi:hypothetical protein
LGSHVDLGAEVLECYSSFEDSAGSVLRKFRAQAEGELVQISIQTRINTVGERIDACQRLLVNRLFDKQLIKREILFIKEVITKEDSIAPEANLAA